MVHDAVVAADVDHALLPEPVDALSGCGGSVGCGGGGRGCRCREGEEREGVDHRVCKCVWLWLRLPSGG